MPSSTQNKKRSSRKSTKNRGSGSKAYQGNASASLQRFFRRDPFLPFSVRQLAYSSSDILGNSTTTIFGTSKVFSLNSLFDPDISGTGHQPYGFDQLCSSTGPYTRYKVIGVELELHVMFPGNSGIYCAVAVHNAGSAATIAGLTATEVAEKHNTSLVFVPGTGSKEKVFKFRFNSLAPLFNWTKSQFSNEMSNTTGPYNASPGSQPRLEISITDMDGTPTSCTVLTKINYRAMLYDRVQLSTS
jgi:hypothetical protein